MSETKMQKQKKIIAMFDDIAKSYDVANRILSLGIDRSWRRDGIKKALSLCKGERLKIADVACGTGDMLQFWHDGLGGREVDLSGIDPSAGMLEVAGKKLKELKNIKLHQGMAQDLNMLDSDSMDVVSISFGIRNVTDLEAGIGEFARVLKNGGILLILEFMREEKRGALDRLMGFYTTKILPLIGGMISRNYRAYAYLPNSIEGFKSTEELSEILKKYGLNIRLKKTYSAGIATLILCQKEIK